MRIRHCLSQSQQKTSSLSAERQPSCVCISVLLPLSSLSLYGICTLTGRYQTRPTILMPGDKSTGQMTTCNHEAKAPPPLPSAQLGKALDPYIQSCKFWAHKAATTCCPLRLSLTRTQGIKPGPTQVFSAELPHVPGSRRGPWSPLSRGGCFFLISLFHTGSEITLSLTLRIGPIFYG